MTKKIRVLKARNKNNENKVFTLTEIEPNVFLTIIGRSKYIGKVKEPIGATKGYGSLEEQAGNDAICFYKVDAKKTGRIWFDEFEMIEEGE